MIKAQNFSEYNNMQVKKIDQDFKVFEHLQMKGWRPIYRQNPVDLQDKQCGKTNMAS